MLTADLARMQVTVFVQVMMSLHVLFVYVILLMLCMHCSSQHLIPGALFEHSDRVACGTSLFAREAGKVFPLYSTLAFSACVPALGSTSAAFLFFRDGQLATCAYCMQCVCMHALDVLSHELIMLCASV